MLRTLYLKMSRHLQDVWEAMVVVTKAKRYEVVVKQRKIVSITFEISKGRNTQIENVPVFVHLFGSE
jgi:hypothetical protein